VALRIRALLRPGLARGARRPQQLLSESRQLPRSYFKGLNFLLNEQPDKAIEAFIEVVKVDPETVELHFALGSLFRRRGETERAIRMHRNLLERSDLGAEQRLHAMVELGEDYLKAGLLDRAEEMFAKLKDSPHRTGALKSLIEIYQQEKDWMKAVETAGALEKDSGQSSQKEIANYYCELALTEATHSRPDGAKRHLESALSAHRKCVRANIILGDILAAAGDHAGAIEAWKQIEQQNPAYLALVAQRLLESHRTLGRAPEGLTLLRGYLSSFPSLDLLDVAFQSTWTPRAPNRPTSWSRTSCAAARLCSAWTRCSRRSSWSRRPSGARSWSSCATWSTATRAGSRVISARIAGSRPASSTGTARRAADGKPTRPAGPRNSSRHREGEMN